MTKGENKGMNIVRYIVLNNDVASTSSGFTRSSVSSMGMIARHFRHISSGKGLDQLRFPALLFQSQVAEHRVPDL